MSLDTLARLRDEHHASCMACGDPRFRLEFECDSNGTLIGRFLPQRDQCSYKGVIHGGMVGLLIDEAMTCCLMSHGVVAVTGDLNLRYVAPVAVDEEIEIHSRIAKNFAPLYHVESSLIQSGATKVKARGRFLRRDEEES